MKKTIQLKESQLLRLIKSKLHEQQRTENYMFFRNLEQMKRQIEELQSIPTDQIEEILRNGHDWADDHISKAKENLDQVYDFMIIEINNDPEIINDPYSEDEIEMVEGRKKTGTPLCARGIASAKAKYDVYPSAYANGHAVQVCKGMVKGLDGTKKKSGAYR
jgi:hypothetical protein